jgi:hypothetical protein
MVGRLEFAESFIASFVVCIVFGWQSSSHSTGPMATNLELAKSELLLHVLQDGRVSRSVTVQTEIVTFMTFT